MNITIKRFSKKGQAINGTLYIDGLRICGCAENADYCLPPGTYQVVRHKCKQKARFVPVILPNADANRSYLQNGCCRCKRLDFVSCNTSMPCFCPQIAIGNGVLKRTDGSIIVGTQLAPGCLGHSKSAFDALYERIRKNVERGNEVQLIIEERYPKPVSKELTLYEMGCQILNLM